MDCHLHLLTDPWDILQVGITKFLSAASPPHCDGRTLVIPPSERVWLPGKMARANASLQITEKTPLSTQNSLHAKLLLRKHFIYFWLCWVFIAMCIFSPVVASGGSSSLQCAGFSLQWLLLLRVQVDWNLRGPGIKPMPSALASQFLSTGPPGKYPCKSSLMDHEEMKEETPLWMISIFRSKQEKVCSEPIGGIWVVPKAEFGSYSRGWEPGGRRFLGRANWFIQAPSSKHQNVASSMRNYACRMWISREVGRARRI